MKQVLTSLFILSATAGAIGCSVYKSSDRDDFNSNAKSRMPAAAHLTLDDVALLANPCSAFNGLTENDLHPLFGSPIHLTMTNQVSRKTATCLVTNRDASRALHSLSVLSCSWKPVDGQTVATVDEFAVQTTEDDLRDEGLSVISSAVSTGDTLRMNCEAYVPTVDLAKREIATDSSEQFDLAGQFSRFTDEMKVFTLSSSGAR